MRHRPAAHAAILAALSLVLLLRTLIPAGYMLAPSGDGFAITLCGPAVPVHHQGHDSPPEPKQPCAYAALGAPALPPVPPLLGIPPSPTGSASSEWTLSPSVAGGPSALPPPSTGPPHRA